MNNIWQRLFLLLLSCLIGLGGCDFPTSKTEITAQVQRVVSGQTIDVLIGEAITVERVRLIGIDAPDLQQDPWGQRGKENLEKLLSEDGKGFAFGIVQLEMGVEDKDDFGRRLAYVWRDGRLLNEEIVKMGYALAVTLYPKGSAKPSHNYKYSQTLNYAQEYARIMGYGIWDTKQPLRTTPAEFRQ